MKNIFKPITTIFIITSFFFCTGVKAQRADSSRFQLDIGVEGGLPTGAANHVSSLALGGTARLNYALASNVSMTLTFGYYDLIGKTVPGQSVKYESITLVPVKAGFKVFVTPGFYFITEAGVGFETVPGGDKKLILGPTLGYTWRYFDVGVKYENFSGSGVSYGMLGARLAYSLNLNFLK